MNIATHPRPFKNIISCFFFVTGVLICVSHAHAFNYLEHRLIGNQALEQFYRLHVSRLHAERLGLMPFSRGAQGNLLFDRLSTFVEVSYGDLNGLAGDHSANPLELEEQLRTDNSHLLRVWAAQIEYDQLHYSGAPNGLLIKLDPQYVNLAAVNLSHFYQYGKSLSGHFLGFDVEAIPKMIDPRQSAAAFNTLNKTNALRMYVTVHTAAIMLAEKAGLHYRRGEIDLAKDFLYYAFLYEAFGAHFLQDSFSGGHLLVNRSVSASVTNNKALHDFYCKHAPQVVNFRGESWRAFGDGYLNAHTATYRDVATLPAIDYPVYTPETERIIQATAVSLGEVFRSFEQAIDQQPIPILLALGKETGSDWAPIFLTEYQAMSQVPLPFETLVFGTYKDQFSADARMINQKPHTRNFVRSRISNSFLIGITTNSFLLYHHFEGLDLRFNFLTWRHTYSVNAEQTKKSTADRWVGLTFSYSLGQFYRFNESDSPLLNIVKAGIRGNYDFWVTNQKFIGLYYYLEAGILEDGQRTSFVAAPQAGIQLGSLFNIRYYDKPALVRIPLQLLLPLKFKVGYYLGPTIRPAAFSGLELDIIF